MTLNSNVRRRRVVRKAAVAALTLVSLTLVACSSGGSGGSSSTAANAGSAESSAPISIKVGISPASVGQIAIWIAQDMGLFKKEGLNVDLVTAASGSAYTAELESNQIDIGTNDLAGIIQADAAGGDLVAIGSLYDLPTIDMICRPGLAGITTGYPVGVRSLAGHTIGTTGPGGGTTIPSFLLAAAGVNLSSVKLINLGSTANFIAAFQAKQVDCFASYQPVPTILTNDGQKYVTVINLADGTGPAEFNNAVSSVSDARRSWAASNGEAIKRFRAAIADAVALAKEPSQTDAIVAAVLKDYPDIDAATVKVFLQTMAKAFGTAPAITQQQFNNVVEINTKAYPTTPLPPATYSSIVVP